MSAQLFSSGLFDHSSAKDVTTIEKSSFVYGDCVFLKDIPYTTKDGSTGILQKGSKWDQITYSLMDSNYYLDHPNEGISGFFTLNQARNVIRQEFENTNHNMKEAISNKVAELNQLSREIDELSANPNQRLVEIARSLHNDIMEFYDSISY